MSTFGGYAYDAVLILVEAIKKAKSTDKEKVRDAIENLKGIVGTAGVFTSRPRTTTVWIWMPLKCSR